MEQLSTQGRSLSQLFAQKAKLIINEVKFKNLKKTEKSKQLVEIETLRSILSQQTLDRKQIFMVYNICQKMPFFTELITKVLKDANIEILLKFFEGATIETHKSLSILIKENDRANNKAYVVLSGSVGILHENRGKRNHGLKIADVRRNSTSLVDPPLTTEEFEAIESRSPNYENLDRTSCLFLRRFGVLAAIIKKGNIFGEVALTIEGPRTASAVTLEPTEVLVFTRDNFKHIQKYYTTEHVKKLCFIRETFPDVDLIREAKRRNQLMSSFHSILYPSVD